MAKSIVSILVSLALLTGGAIYEQHYVKSTFSEFNEILETLQLKTEEHTAVKEDGYSAQKYWLECKSQLHAYIPHNDIKDIDYWLAEAVSLISTEDFDLALSKLEVLIEICEHIPGTFGIKFENIF